MGHATPLPSPLPGYHGAVLLVGMLWCYKAGGELPWPATVVHAEQGGLTECFMEVLREAPALSYSLLSLSLPLPACQPRPSHWFSLPEGTANGAALAMGMLILARCFPEQLKSMDSLLLHTGPHSRQAVTVTSAPSPQSNHNPSPGHHTHKPV